MDIGEKCDYEECDDSSESEMHSSHDALVHLLHIYNMPGIYF